MEKILGEAVSYAKQTIIVRSVVVPFGNLMSNLLHLTLRGIDPITAVKGLRAKFIETTEFVKNRETIQQLQADIAANWTDEKRRKVLAARIRALEEANAAMSIAPLVKAGEFSTIAEDLDEADLAIREGRWGEFVREATDKLGGRNVPGWAETGLKNVLITKDTALYKGLNRMVQYGDFISKAVLYDHLTGRKGMNEREALDEILEEFVQYNRLPGRSRDFLESTGLLWFWNYKLRIQKIAMKMLRERPFSSLMLMNGSGTFGVDNVMSGSLAGTMADGSIGY